MCLFSVLFFNFENLKKTKEMTFWNCEETQMINTYTTKTNDNLKSHSHIFYFRFVLKLCNRDLFCSFWKFKDLKLFNLENKKRNTKKHTRKTQNKMEIWKLKKKWKETIKKKWNCGVLCLLLMCGCIIFWTL